MKFREQTTSQTLHLNNLQEITIQRGLNLVREQNFQQAASWLLKSVVKWKKKNKQTNSGQQGIDRDLNLAPQHVGAINRITLSLRKYIRRKYAV